MGIWRETDPFKTATDALWQQAYDTRVRNVDPLTNALPIPSFEEEVQQAASVDPDDLKRGKTRAVFSPLVVMLSGANPLIVLGALLMTLPAKRNPHLSRGWRKWTKFVNFFAWFMLFETSVQAIATFSMTH